MLLAKCFHIDFNIGVDALCYRDGKKDLIGFVHANDTQGTRGHRHLAVSQYIIAIRTIYF
jgi:hypothetical protein